MPECELHLWLRRKSRQDLGQGEPHSPGLRAVMQRNRVDVLLVAWCPTQASRDVSEVLLPSVTVLRGLK